MTNNEAPLARLRRRDQRLWADLIAAAPNPAAAGTNPVVQALAAALLGNHGLAIDVIRNGLGFFYINGWPEPKGAGRVRCTACGAHTAAKGDGTPIMLYHEPGCEARLSDFDSPHDTGGSQ